MSHIVSIKSQIRDPAALSLACRRLGLSEPVVGTAHLYGGHATGLIVQLPGWRYPVVVNTDTAELKYDTFNGAWGDQSQLDRLMQAYCVEKTRLEARRAGHAIIEQAMPDGSIKLTIQVGGAA